MGLSSQLPKLEECQAANTPSAGYEPRSARLTSMEASLDPVVSRNRRLPMSHGSDTSRMELPCPPDDQGLLWPLCL